MAFHALAADLSAHQGRVNWPALKTAGLYALILRAGYGREASQKDKYFEENYAGAGSVGLPVGAYWFSYAKDPADAETEARACLEVLAGRPLQLPLYFDQEENSIPAAGRTACALAFLNYIRAHSPYRTGYYSYTAWFAGVDLAAIRAACDSIWLADYRANYDTAIPRDIHQYTSSGSLPGISGRVDLDHVYRDFVSETKGEGEMDLSFDTYKIGPVSEGDRQSLAAFAEGLGLGYSHQGDYIVIGPASLGDRKRLLALAQSLGLGAEGVAPQEPDEPAEGEDKPEGGEDRPGDGEEGDTGGQESGGSGQEGGEKTALTLTGAGPAQAELIKALAGLWGLGVKEGGE